MQSLDAFAGGKLAGLEAKSLRRWLKPTRRHDGAVVERDGRRLISFSCNDYLGLSQHPEVRAAAAEAALNYGAGASASRLVTGDHPLLGDLEKRLARLKGTEAACVFGSGYLANTGVIPTLVGPGDVVLVDALAHACIWAGAQLSGAKIVKFAHNDVGDLERLLQAERPLARHALVATDGVFSMDGDIAPLGKLSELCARHDAWLLSDDAHGVGVLAEGRGSAALFPDAEIPLQMGTLSKALGSYGGYLCGSQAVVDLLKTRARTLVYATGLPPASAAAALTALDLIETLSLSPRRGCSRSGLACPTRKVRSCRSCSEPPTPPSPPPRRWRRGASWSWRSARRRCRRARPGCASPSTPPTTTPT